MTLKQQIIFSSTLVAILAGMAGGMTYKYSFSLRGIYTEAVDRWQEEVKVIEILRESIQELEVDIVKNTFLSDLEWSKKNSSIEEVNQVFFLKVEEVNAGITSYRDLGERQSEVAKKISEHFYPVINIGQELQSPLNGSTASKQKALDKLTELKRDIFNALEASREVSFQECQKLGADVTATLQTIFNWVIGVCFVTFILAIVFGQLIARDLSKAIEGLKLAAQRIEDGDYSQSLSMNRKDEFGKLAGTFNNLADDLQKTKTIEIQNKKLGHLNMELKRKNDSLDSFVYRVSHDLKAPVVNLQSLLKLVSKQIEDQENEVLSKTVFFMEKTSEKLGQTIFDLLEVSRIERSLEMAKSRVNIKDLLEEVVIENSEVIGQSEAVISHDFGVTSEVYFSKANLKSLLANLLTNSIKYRSPERKPEVHLQSKIEDGFVIISIADNGLGIDLERHKEKLFGMFSRFHDHVEGSGVGLYIVKKLIDESGGKLEIESKVGEGTTITLYFLDQEEVTSKVQTVEIV